MNAGPPLKPEEGAQDNLAERLQALQEEVRRLRETVGPINDRIADLERVLESITPPKPVSPPSPEPTRVPPREPVPKMAATTIPPPPPSPAVKAPIPAKPPPPPPVKKAPAKPREWEQILGGNWLARVGVVALIIGVAFFLKFAFDNNWLGPISRVILGVVAGLAMIGGGYYWRKRYPTLAQAISGGGIALLYLSIFAAFNIFNLIPLYPAVGLLLLVSIGSAVLALRLNSMALAIIGILGAFSAPFILGTAASEAAQTGSGIQLLAYVIVVDLGVLALSTFRNWRWFNLLAIFGSLMTYGAWYFEFGDQAGLLIQQLSITLIFIIFFGATSLFHLIWRRPAQGFDYALMVINATAYFGISYGLMHEDLREWMGSFTLLLALLYGCLAYLAVLRGAENFRLSLFARGIALVFLTIAIPIQLGDKAWTTIALVAEGTVLMWLSLRLRISHFRGYSYAVFAIVAIRLMFFDTSIDMRHIQPVFNERFLAFVVSIAAMYLTSYFCWKQQQEKGQKLGYPVFLVAAIIFSIWVIAAEVISYRHTPVTLQGSLSLIVLLVLAGVTILYHVVWRRVPKVSDLVLMVIGAVAYFGISGLLWEDLRAWMGSIYLVLALFYAGSAYTAIRRGAEYTRLGSFSLGIALVFLTVAIPVQLRDTAWTTIAWAAELVVLIWLSSALRLPQLRNYSYAVAIVMAGRLLIFDTSVNLHNFRPVLNERFLAFLVGIAAMYLAAYLLWRAQKTLPKWRIPVTTFIVAANFFSLWLLSFEVWDYFGSQLALTPAESNTAIALRNAQNLSLTVLWTVYAVILLVIGIVKRWRLVRLGALALLAIPIIKVFVYDVFALERVYRIVAFVGLGLLLLISAYLYQRYSKAIRSFLVKK
ncbi:MAG: hypothetical protein A2Z75_08930 [Chloroflexi bacterium RBG_13_50_10]|nr:MAG: hypothetical protein A2Z75_08930 [Chloroflexi bacterium RBG_13_50_10]